jgi:WD40 repeat protein
MVVAILASRFAPSSRGLRRAEPLPYNNSNLRHRQLFDRRKKRKSNYSLVVNNRGKKAWRKIRNVTKASRAFRQSVLDSTSDDETDEDDDALSTDNETYDDYYYSLTGRPKQVNGLPEQESEHRNDRSEFNTNQHEAAGPNGRNTSISRNTTSHRRKPFRAISFVTSVASDMDLIADWIFFRSSVLSNRQYQEQLNESLNSNNTDDGGQYRAEDLIPPTLIRLSFISCILGTFMWLVLATDGRIITPICRRFGIDSLSMGFVLFICVLVEDIPQITLTFLIEEYYEEGRSLSNYALCNIIVSLYDLLIKLAEAYDDRNDYVETGVWCRASIRAHRDTITSVVTLPPSDDWDSTLVPANSHSSSRENSKLDNPLIDINENIKSDIGTSYYTNMSIVENASKRNRLNRGSKNFVAQFSTRTTSRSIPRTRLLTTSLDGTTRLWDTDSFPDNVSKAPCEDISQQRQVSDSCVRIFQQPSDSITCISLLGPSLNGGIHTSDAPSSLNHESSEQHSATDESLNDTYYITGSRKGVTRLWHLNATQSVRDYVYNETNFGSVTCIEVIVDGETFISGYEKGPVILWSVWTGACIAIYHGHYGTMNTFHTVCCSLDDELLFVTGSADKCLHLWNTSQAMTEYRSIQEEQADQPTSILERRNEGINSPTRLNRLLQYIGQEQEQTPQDQGLSRQLKYFISEKKFEGHVGQILCVCCIEPSKAFVSGSSDGTARLWSVQTGNCLQVFTGHNDGVTTIQSVDHVTFLTGSKDTTIRLWDIISGTAVRIYHGHTSAITDVAVTADDKSFVSTSLDRTIKVWVLTCVQDDSSTSHSHVDGREDDHNDGMMYDGLCRGLDPL